MSTFLNGSEGELEIHGYVLLFCVHERKYDMGEIGGYFKMLEPRGGGDDSLDIEFLNDLKVTGSVKIAQE